MSRSESSWATLHRRASPVPLAQETPRAEEGIIPHRRTGRPGGGEGSGGHRPAGGGCTARPLATGGRPPPAGVRRCSCSGALPRQCPGARRSSGQIGVAAAGRGEAGCRHRRGERRLGGLNGARAAAQCVDRPGVRTPDAAAVIPSPTGPRCDGCWRVVGLGTSRLDLNGRLTGASGASESQSDTVALLHLGRGFNLK